MAKSLIVPTRRGLLAGLGMMALAGPSLADYRSAPVSALNISRNGGALNAALTGKPILARMGDSRNAQELQIQNLGAANQAINRMGQGLGSWVQFLSYGRVSCPLSHNIAVSGSTTTDILNSQLATLAGLSPRPTHVLIETITNDIGVTAQATIKSNLLNIWAAVKSFGIVPVQLVDMPRALSTWNTTSRNKSYEINAWMRATCVGIGVVLIDPTPSVVDLTNASGDPLSSMVVADFIHPQYNEAFVVGTAIVAYFNKLGLPNIWWPASQANAYDATNNPRGNFLPSGGLMVGTAGTNTGTGASGTVPTGWNHRVVSGTCTAVASIAARSDGGPGNCLQTVVTATTKSLIRISPTTSIVPGAGYAAGDLMQYEADISISGGVLVNYATLILQDLGAASAVQRESRDMKGGVIGATQYEQPAAYAGRLITDPVLIGSGTTSQVTRLEMEVDAGGSVTLQFASPNLHKVI